jgi:plasmid maintenance system antidote protein VapI
MKNIEILQLSNETKKRLLTFAKMYRQNAHIVIEIVSFNDNRLIVRVEQKDLVNGKFLSKKELVDRIRDMFHGEIPETWKLVVSAVDYDRKDINDMSVEWIKKRMDKLSLKCKHVSVHTGIDKCTISSILNGNKELTKWHKVAFYYFFKYYEVTQFNSVMGN